MKRKFAKASSSAILPMSFVLSLVIFAPGYSFAQSGASQASEMVFVKAAFNDTVDGSKIKPGDAVQLTVSKKAKLKDGTELPVGTAIVGEVAADDMQLTGASKVALRFTKVQIKNGKSFPIKATIQGILPPAGSGPSGTVDNPGYDSVNAASQPHASVDEAEALDGLDLHSKIASSNSGVLVATSKHGVKVKRGTELSLAIAAQAN